MRVCLDCPALIPSGKSRCSQHERARDRARGTRQERGYDAAHDQLRAHWQDRMDAGQQVRCWRCGDPIDPKQWDLGHDDRDRSRYRGPEHVGCNRGTSGRTHM